MMIWGFFGAMPPKNEPEEKQDDVDEDVAERMDQFFNLGFDEFAAFGLAWGNVSVSETRELLKKGCSHKHAAEILL